MSKQNKEKINKLTEINYKLGIGLFILNCLFACFEYLGSGADARGLFLVTIAPIHTIFNAMLLYMTGLENIGVNDKNLSCIKKASNINLFLFIFAFLFYFIFLLPGNIFGFIYGLIGTIGYLIVLVCSIWSLILIGKKSGDSSKHDSDDKKKKCFRNSVVVSILLYVILFLLF